MKNPFRQKQEMEDFAVESSRVTRKPAVNVLMDTGSVFAKDGPARTAMTLSCKDTEYIPKVKDAGKVVTRKGKQVQVMHNGMLVKAGGYHGDWMVGVIEELKGHHEPQEEKVFYEILKRLPDTPVMIELGSFWAYYTLWLRLEKKHAVSICCEPDPVNMAIGKENAEINGVTDIKFYDAASGAHDGDIVELQMDSDPSKAEKVEVRTIDSLIEENKIEKVDLLHLDIQGFELDAFKGAINSVKNKKIRFVIVSTHHYFFSKDPLTHQKCMDFITQNGGNIITSHTVLESFSGDGLIAASFDPADKDFTIDISLNHSDDALFRSYEQDLAILIKEYDSLTV